MSSPSEQPAAPTDAQSEGGPEATTYSLTPPVGTMYWKRQTFKWSTSVSGYATSDWSAEIYVYVSSASPDDPGFTAKGGLVTIIVVHSGNFQTTDTVKLGLKFLNKIYPSTVPMFMQHYPEEWNGEVIGDISDERRKYTVSYKEDLQMLKNGGNETFTFTASYETDYQRHNTSQGSDSTRFLLSYVTTTTQIDKDIIVPIHGLSVLRFDDNNAFPLTLDFSTGYGAWVGPKSVTIDLDFSKA
ncbi:hypothetical protein ONZ45_g18565 [Pleurotus djamor]|nr:hypothetical protein ONZ45_g18565 [Pleurotus djamor]